MARPAEYTPELAQAFCLRLAEVGAVVKVCAEDGMPSKSSVYEWLRTQQGFEAMYRAAREEFADAEFDRLSELASAEPKTDDRGNVDHAWVNRQKMIVNTMQWRLARLAPKKYSERVELTGAEGDPLMPHPDVMTEERMLQGVRRLAFLLARADQVMKNRQPAPLLLVHDVKHPAPEPAPTPPQPSCPFCDAAPGTGHDSGCRYRGTLVSRIATAPAPEHRPSVPEDLELGDNFGSREEQGWPPAPPGPRTRI